MVGEFWGWDAALKKKPQRSWCTQENFEATLVSIGSSRQLTRKDAAELNLNQTKPFANIQIVISRFIPTKF